MTHFVVGQRGGVHEGRRVHAELVVQEVKQRDVLAVRVEATRERLHVLDQELQCQLEVAQPLPPLHLLPRQLELLQRLDPTVVAAALDAQLAKLKVEVA